MFHDVSRETNKWARRFVLDTIILKWTMSRIPNVNLNWTSEIAAEHHPPCSCAYRDVWDEGWGGGAVCSKLADVFNGKWWTNGKKSTCNHLDLLSWWFYIFLPSQITIFHHHLGIFSNHLKQIEDRVFSKCPNIGGHQRFRPCPHQPWKSYEPPFVYRLV